MTDAGGSLHEAGIARASLVGPVGTATSRRRGMVVFATALALGGFASTGCSDGTRPSSVPSATTISVSPQPTVSVYSPAIAESDLRQAQAAYYAAYLAAVARPGDSTSVDRLLDVYSKGSPGAQDVSDRMKALAKEGYAARPGPDGYFIVIDVDVPATDEGSVARVTACTYYDGVTYDTKHDGPDGKPITVNDSAQSSQTRFRYVREANAWKLVGGDVLKTWAGENRCPAET